MTVGILVVDVLALVVIGGLFLWLYMDPGSIEVKEGQQALTSAPDYISLQAKAFIALVIAGAGGVGAAAAKQPPRRTTTSLVPRSGHASIGSPSASARTGPTARKGMLGRP